MDFDFDSFCLKEFEIEALKGFFIYFVCVRQKYSLKSSLLQSAQVLHGYTF